MKKVLEEQLQRNQQEMDSMKQSWEQRLKEVQSAQEVRQGTKIVSNGSHFVVFNTEIYEIQTEAWLQSRLVPF